MGDEGSGAAARGGSAGDTYASGYRLELESALAATTSTAAEGAALTQLSATVTAAFGGVAGAMPPEFEQAAARIQSIGQDHVADIDKSALYVSGCVAAAQGCLAAYRNATVEQVANTARMAAKARLQHGGLLGGAGKKVGGRLAKTARVDEANKLLPKRKPGTRTEASWSHERSRSGQRTESSSTRIKDERGGGTSSSHSQGVSGGRYSEESTRTRTKTVGSATRTTTDYSGRSHDAADGANEVNRSGRTVTTTSPRRSSTRGSGDMGLPVAP